MNFNVYENMFKFEKAGFSFSDCLGFDVMCCVPDHSK